MKQLAIIEYTFIFEPSSETWQSGFEFERDLADFFAAHGLEANMVDVTGGATRRVIYISRMDKLDVVRQAADKPPISTANSSQIAFGRVMQNLKVKQFNK